ncbi:MAG: carboxypeptidase regulatory-like domain-containing protein [Chitinophagaceae bacterium]|nr:carboxypeptidase regulatory-like domain-containing protein [Chitinophagaceae bacterium]
MRKSLLSIITTMSVLALFFISCQPDIDDPNPPVNPGSGNQVNDNIMVTAGIRGIVINENGQPMSGITVTSSTYTTTTDRYGMFYFKNISMSKANATVKVEQTGYFTAFKTFPATVGRTHNVRLRLIPKTSAGNFTASSGGTINIGGGAKMVMPASAVTDASGNAYTGQVNVAMAWINPESSILPELVPGDLRGITTGGEERGLSTYGMIGVELTSPSGQVLKIASGKTAELTFPVPASLAGTAPATIDLWHFDEATARWKQDGTATKTGNNYIAQVSHFSFWNCDAPYPMVNFCVTLVNANGNAPLINVQVRIKRPNGTYGYGWTDSLGNVCGKVPKGEALVLEAIDQCNNIVFTQNIGPYNTDYTLGQVAVVIPPANSLTITGTVVNCANANVTSGYAIVYTSGAYGYNVPLTNGTFSLTILRCSSSSVNFTVIGVDNNAVQQSVPVSGTGTSGTVNVGTIQACGTSSAQYVELIINGTPYNFVSPPSTITAIDSSAIIINPPYLTETDISAISYGLGSNSYCFISFFHSGVPGLLPLAGISFYIDPVVQGWLITTVNPKANITTLQPIGGFIEGSTNVVINSPTLGGVVNVQCNFRVRRS